MELADSFYLWLMPQKETYDEFQKIIQDLSKTYGTPRFEPHVTLVSGLSGKEDLLVEKIDALALGKHEFSVTTKDIDYRHGFFTSFLLNIQNTPEIDQFNEQARQHLTPFGQGPYHPHLSLLYGDITSQEQKRIIADLNCTGQTILLNTLKLVRGDSDVSQWQVIRARSLIK